MDAAKVMLYSLEVGQTRINYFFFQAFVLNVPPTSRALMTTLLRFSAGTAIGAGESARTRKGAKVGARKGVKVGARKGARAGARKGARTEKL